MTETIQLSILFGRTHRPDIAIGDFWRQAQAAVSHSGSSLQCSAIYATHAGRVDVLGEEELALTGLLISEEGRVGALLNRWIATPGPLGMAARLGKHNLASRNVARAVAADKKLTEAICKSNVIVAADPEADRAIWNLRSRTSAQLLHGPFAMANALAELSHA